MGAASRQESGVTSVRSPLSFADTIKNLLVAVERRGMIVFARIDHAKAGEETGRRLRPTELILFGYPETEAPLIAKIPLLGLDFPQRVLVWEDEQACLWLSYDDPIRIARRFGVGADLLPKFEAIGASLEGIAAKAPVAKSSIAGA